MSFNRKQTPIATNDHWNLYLLGFCKENVRKAVLINYLTNDELSAKVNVGADITGKNTQYTVIEAVDEKTNHLVDFTKTFVVPGKYVKTRG